MSSSEPAGSSPRFADRNRVRPRVVVFDLGKVLLNFDYQTAVKNLLAYCAISPAELQQLIDQSPLLFRFELGYLTPEQFFAEVLAITGFRGDFEFFSRFFADIFTPIPPMIELNAQLRAARVPTFLFSNTNELAVRHIQSRFPFFRHFDGYILSYQHGAMKPDAKLYEVVEKTTGHAGHEIFYLDDRPENVAAGLQRGWQAIIHQSAETTLQAIRQCGLLGTS